MTLRRGETLLLTIGIPVVFLVFFSEVHVLPTGTTEPVSFFVPGHPRPGRHVHGDGVPRHRHRVRARLRRARSGWGRRRWAGPGCSGPRSPPCCWSRWSRRRCWYRWGSGWAGTPAPAAPGRPWARRWRWPCWPPWPSGASACSWPGVLRAEVNLAARQRAVPGAAPAGRDDRAAGQAARRPAGLAQALPAAALSDGLHAALGTGTPVPARSWVVLAAWARGGPAGRRRSPSAGSERPPAA